MTRKSIGACWLGVIVVVSGLGLVFWSTPSSAQDGGAMATVSALKTQIADLSATLETLSTPSAAAEPTSMPAPAAVEWKDIGGGLQYYYYFGHNLNRVLFLLAEVRNTNDYSVETPLIQFTFLDKDGNILGEASPQPLYPIVAPNQTTPLQTLVDEKRIGEWASERVNVHGRDGVEAKCSLGIELRDVTEVEKTVRKLQLDGKVFNGGSLPLEDVLLWIATYRKDGVFAGAWDETVVSATGIPPGKFATFSLSVTTVWFPGLVMSEGRNDYSYRLFTVSLATGLFAC